MAVAFAAIAGLTLFAASKFRDDWTAGFAALEVVLCLVGAGLALTRRFRFIGALLLIAAFLLLNIGLKWTGCSDRSWGPCFYGSVASSPSGASAWHDIVDLGARTWPGG